MRIGCCSNMNAMLPDGTGREVMEKIKNAGFDYLELPFGATNALSDAEFHSLVSQVEKADIPVESMNSAFPGSLKLVGEDVDEYAVEKFIKQGLMRANELGARIVGVGSGPSRSIPTSFPFDKGYDQLVTLFKRMSDEAEKYGIMVVIEPLRKAESNVINTFKEGVELAKRVDRSNVKVLADFYHMVVENENPEVLVEYSSYLQHAHFANPALGTEKERSFPQCADEWDYEPFFACLKNAGYSERLSLEAYTTDFDHDAPRSLEVMRYLSN